MPIRKIESLSELSYHFQFLGRIYAFIGWMGVIGSVFLFLAAFNAGPETATASQSNSALLPQTVQAVLLACWSVLLLNFSKDIAGPHAWSIGIGGYVLSVLNLLSVPIGTAIGTYTLWVLFKCRSTHHRSLKDKMHV